MFTRAMAPIVACMLAITAAGCGVRVEPLMPTPVLYTDGRVDPFAHLEAEFQTPIADVLYATNRQRVHDWKRIEYANAPGERVSLGAAAMRIGGPGMTWQRLHAASMTAEREEPIEIELSGVIERGGFPVDDPAEPLSVESAEFIEAINNRIDITKNPDVFIFVHGAKVNFYNACAFTAQIAHFMGRDVVGIAFSWPTRQDIINYATGADVRRARDAGPALASLIEFLGAESNVRRIHVISWSAGARVVISAMDALRAGNEGESLESLHERLRIGVLLFAAGDIPVSRFLETIETAHALADRVAITISDDDGALISASQFMGGGRRLGQYGKMLSDDERLRLNAMDRLEVIDVSAGKEERGFDITGHRYWFNHSWASTDALFLLRLGLPAGERGLEQVEGTNIVWRIPADYPDLVTAIIKSRNVDDWSDD